MSQYITTADVYAACQWPEFTAFARRLGIPIDLPIRDLTIEMKHNSCVMYDMTILGLDRNAHDFMYKHIEKQMRKETQRLEREAMEMLKTHTADELTVATFTDGRPSQVVTKESIGIKE